MMKDAVCSKLFACLALVAFAAAVFLIAAGHFWNGLALIGAGASLSSAAGILKKKTAGTDRACESADGNSTGDIGGEEL